MQFATAAATAQVAATETVFLMGRPPMGEFLGYMSETLEGKQQDISVLADRWRAANDHVQEIEKQESGYADHPPVSKLPPELAEVAARTLTDPIVRGTFAIVPIEIGMVELDRLVVFQKRIDLDHVRALRAKLPTELTPEQLFHFCMPIGGREDPEVVGGLISQLQNQSVFAFATPSTDARVLDTQMIDAATIPGLKLNGVPSKIIVVGIGYGVNFLSAIRVAGRLVLNNGSHRAYALRDAGVSHVPCLIQNASRRDELEVIGNAEVNQRYDAYFVDARPPLLKDYFDEQLRLHVHVAKKVRQIRVVVQHEALDAPGA